MKRVIVHAKRRIFDAFFKIDEAEVSYERFDGQMSDRLRRLCFERGDSVAAVIYNRDSRKAIFTNQFKYPTYEKGPGWIMELVAGIPEADEPRESALRREAQEEAGYRLGAVTPIVTFYVSPGGSSERIILYYAEVSQSDKTGPGGGLRSEGEDIKVVELSLDEIERLLLSGAIQDAKTLVGIQWLLAKQRNGREVASHG